MSQWGVVPLLFFPKVHNQLHGFADVQEQVVVFAPPVTGFQPPLCTYHYAIVLELLVDTQSWVYSAEQQRAENTALWCSDVEGAMART